jgi:hypothetical protein
MGLCPSGLLVSAIVLIIILNDMFSYRIDNLFEHLFLGVIVCTLFFTLCNYGLEQINWLFLVLIPVCIFLKWIYISSNNIYTPPNNECEVCQESVSSCDCLNTNIQVEPKVQEIEQVNTKVKIKARLPKTQELNCPANPLTLATKCGITRYFE